MGSVLFQEVLTQLCTCRMLEKKSGNTLAQVATHWRKSSLTYESPEIVCPFGYEGGFV
jgi:hypothetical protein